MAGTTTGGVPSPEEFPPLPKNEKPGAQPPLITSQNIQYANLLKPKPMVPQITRVPPKHVNIVHGEPNITWKTSEVKSLIIQENLQYAIIGKFSYGKPDVQEL
ncbi:hypothetical protein MTR67_022722 [Solanum verrucosum]|uniref:Uncharacterized protein n=1 Tax=Solanum verrucosum TaxID=315347 RepID=A0AAF0QSA0_SOLVR|nr:hypothetical protein MTR67_022722 [Solanum verrucosum]